MHFEQGGRTLRCQHKLFATTSYTLCEWIRLQRLEAVHRQLRDPHCHLSIGELAFRWGFSDQAQFTRAFRQQYGCNPREVRGGCRSGWSECSSYATTLDGATEPCMLSNQP